MKVIIDILTPKQCLFFSRLSKNLQKRGHQIFRTTRKYREVLELLKLKGVDARVIGEHGGKELGNKLKASAHRTLELAFVFEEVKPDIAVSFSSPEMARVSYGFKVPHVCVNDSPHAEAVARLTVPLVQKLLTPKMIPKKCWTRFGIAPKKIVQYNTLDPWVWLRDLKPDRRVLQDLGLDESQPILTFRTEESFAAYLLGKTQKETLIIQIVKEIMDKQRDLQIVVVPRYREQVEALRDAFKDRIVICESIIDGSSLLYYTSVFVGGGGTMNTEAALLGVPTFTCYPDEPHLVEKYLIRKKLVMREIDSEKLVERILVTLSNLDEVKKIQSERARRLVRTFEDPIEVITKEVEILA